MTKNNISFQRGYTGHEHWDSFQLIDMNGRFYDPILARFLSPDPYVQAPDNTQSFNRYSYCLNNPLKYTDPSGEFWHIIIGAAIGGLTNSLFGLASGDVDNFGEFAAYFGVGSIAGALSAATCGGISSAMAGAGFSAGFLGSSTAAAATSGFKTGAILGGAGGAISGSVIGFGNTLVGGESWGQAIGQLHLQSLIGAVSGALVGGVAGGIDAYLDNRNVWTGDDIAMGRSAFSFDNTDKNPDIFWGKSNRPFTVKYAGQLLSSDPRYNYIQYGNVVDANGCSVNGLSKLENYTFRSQSRPLPQNFKGCAYLDIIDYGGHKVVVDVDGIVPKIINGHYVIPQGSKILNINVSINPDRLSNVVSPIKYFIYGVKK